MIVITRYVDATEKRDAVTGQGDRQTVGIGAILQKYQRDFYCPRRRASVTVRYSASIPLRRGRSSTAAASPSCIRTAVAASAAALHGDRPPKPG